MNCAEDAAHAAAPSNSGLGIKLPLPGCCLGLWHSLPSTPAPPPPSYSCFLSCGCACCLACFMLVCRLLPAVSCHSPMGQLKRSLIVFCADFPYLYTIHVAIFVGCFHTASANFHYAREPWLIYITIYKYGNAHHSVIRSCLNDCQTTRPE